MDNKIIILQIAQQEVQSFAEAFYGRKLTDLELYRINHCWDESGAADWARIQFIDACIRDATNDKNDWSSVDKEYQDK